MCSIVVSSRLRLRRSCHEGRDDATARALGAGHFIKSVTLREFGARTRDALDEAIRRAVDLIDGGDAAAWFTHCGYSGQLE